MPSNDDAAQRLIDAILPKLTEALLPQLTEAVENQIKGVVAKNDDLLAKLATKKVPKDDFAKLLADTKQLTDMLDPKKPKPDATAPVIISKADALDRQKYLAAQAEAVKRGVPRQIGAPNAAQKNDDSAKPYSSFGMRIIATMRSSSLVRSSTTSPTCWRKCSIFTQSAPGLARVISSARLRFFSWFSRLVSQMVMIIPFSTDRFFIAASALRRGRSCNAYFSAKKMPLRSVAITAWASLRARRFVTFPRQRSAG